MKTLLPILVCVFLLCACSGPKQLQTAETAPATSGHTRTKEVVFLDANAYKLTEVSIDKTYGLNPSNPVKVGGVSEQSGPQNERRFLNGLTGPNGEAIKYYRAGSCCGFKTPNGFDGMGMLDRYKVYWEGSKDTAILYLNMYDKGDLKVPVGFKSRSEN